MAFESFVVVFRDGCWRIQWYGSYDDREAAQRVTVAIPKWASYPPASLYRIGMERKRWSSNLPAQINQSVYRNRAAASRVNPCSLVKQTI